MVILNNYIKDVKADSTSYWRHIGMPNFGDKVNIGKEFERIHHLLHLELLHERDPQVLRGDVVETFLETNSMNKFKTSHFLR